MPDNHSTLHAELCHRAARPIVSRVPFLIVLALVEVTMGTMLNIAVFKLRRRAMDVSVSSCEVAEVTQLTARGRQSSRA